MTYFVDSAMGHRLGKMDALGSESIYHCGEC